MAPALVENALKSHNEIVRPIANFSPSLWGDQFLMYNSDSQVKEEYSKAIGVLKNEAESMLKLAYESNIVDALNMIDTLERLGVSYHFENEIEEKIEKLFNLNTNYEDESYDLYTVALHFRVFRQHGHRISPDIFSKLRDGERKFEDDLKSDAKGLLSLYEASYLRIHGEDILEDALAFAKSNLKSMSQNLSIPLNKQVVHALVLPFHFGNPRVEARHFISFYEEDETKNDTLLRFAKLDYNLLQILHKEELQEISRLDISQLEGLPDYVKPLYEALLELYVQFEQELSKQGRSYGVYYAKEALKEIVRSFNVEAKWFIEGYLPPFAEYLDNALITCTYCYLTPSSLLGTKFAIEEHYKWLSEKPKMLVAGLKICRFINDIATYDIEKERGHIATGIESYMKENGVRKEEAMDKFFEMATNAWKDTNEECLKPSSHPRDVLMRILNFDRMIDVTNKNNQDGYTHPEKVLKPHILALFVDPIKI